MPTISYNGLSTTYDFADYAGTDPLYIGSVSADGQWMIERFSLGSQEMRYCLGGSDYATNWTGRALLTYSLPNEV
jgi:hypothetical protein